MHLHQGYALPRLFDALPAAAPDRELYVFAKIRFSYTAPSNCLPYLDFTMCIALMHGYMRPHSFTGSIYSWYDRWDLLL